MENIGSTLMGLLIFGGLIALVVSHENGKEKARKKVRETLENAQAAFHASLAQLKSRPGSADLRQETLRLGRVYSNLTRNQQGVTVFDEVALMNDINAAAGGTQASTETVSPRSPELQIEERLRNLAALKSKGLLDDLEYSDRRKRILDEI